MQPVPYIFPRPASRPSGFCATAQALHEPCTSIRCRIREAQHSTGRGTAKRGRLGEGVVQASQPAEQLRGEREREPFAWFPAPDTDTTSPPSISATPARTFLGRRFFHESSRVESARPPHSSKKSCPRKGNARAVSSTVGWVGCIAVPSGTISHDLHRTVMRPALFPGVIASTDIWRRADSLGGRCRVSFAVLVSSKARARVDTG